MTRSDLIEIIARAIVTADLPNEPVEDWIVNGDAVLTALSAAGLAVVPREATERGLDGYHPVDYEDGPCALYRVMVAAEDLTGERG